MKILVVSGNLHFLESILENVDGEIIYMKDIDIEKNRTQLKDADVIFCEWCLDNAVWASKNKYPHQRLYIRLHRYEMITAYPKSVLWKNVNGLIFISPTIQEMVLEKIPTIPKHLTHLVYNHCRSSTDSPLSRKNSLVLGMMGYASGKIKRPDLALKVLKLLQNKNPKFSICFKGKEPVKTVTNAEYLKKIFNPLLKKSTNVMFENHSPNIGEWFQKIRFLLCCSDVEGSHQSSAEAMADGVIPVIVGGFYTEYNAHLLYPPRFCHKTVEEASEFIYHLVEKPDLYRIQQQFCIDFVEKYFRTNVLDSYRSILFRDEWKIELFSPSQTYIMSNKPTVVSNLVAELLCDDLTQPFQNDKIITILSETTMSFDSPRVKVFINLPAHRMKTFITSIPTKSLVYIDGDLDPSYLSLITYPYKRI